MVAAGYHRLIGPMRSSSSRKAASCKAKAQAAQRSCYMQASSLEEFLRPVAVRACGRNSLTPPGHLYFSCSPPHRGCRNVVAVILVLVFTCLVLVLVFLLLVFLLLPIPPPAFLVLWLWHWLSQLLALTSPLPMHVPAPCSLALAVSHLGVTSHLRPLCEPTAL